jgi:hypothetical protein
MSANGIAHLSTREARQIAKLNLAASNRTADYAHRDTAHNADARNTYDESQLPAQYTGNSVSDNPNTGGLVVGRPWVGTYNPGIYQRHYNGYWNNDVTFFGSATLLGSAVVNNFVIASESTTHSETYLGYFRPDYTGTWTLSLTSDDGGALWIGDTARAPTNANPLLTTTIGTVSNTISLVEGKLYPFLIAYGNNGGPGALSVSYSHTGQSSTTDFTGKLFYNAVTNGI